jgi:hypothetical protein
MARNANCTWSDRNRCATSRDFTNIRFPVRKFVAPRSPKPTLIIRERTPFSVAFDPAADSTILAILKEI